MMKVYMNKGHTMNAAIVLHPCTIEARKDPETMPESIREWTITINGDADEEIILAGTLKDLETVITGLRNVWIDIAMQEKEGSA
jgi:hypothetical protein